MLNFIAAFATWTLLAYAMHWIMHQRWCFLWLRKLHGAHHAKRYDTEFIPGVYDRKYDFDYRGLFFWFGGVKETLGVLIGISLPCFIACVVFDNYWLLLVHYIYESIFSDKLVEHNPAVRGVIADFFGVGEYHLKHHLDPSINFAVGLSAWDALFKTKGE